MTPLRGRPRSRRRLRRSSAPPTLIRPRILANALGDREDPLALEARSRSTGPRASSTDRTPRRHRVLTASDVLVDQTADRERVVAVGGHASVGGREHGPGPARHRLVDHLALERDGRLAACRRLLVRGEQAPRVIDRRGRRREHLVGERAPARGGCRACRGTRAPDPPRPRARSGRRRGSRRRSGRRACTPPSRAASATRDRAYSTSWLHGRAHATHVGDEVLGAEVAPSHRVAAARPRRAPTPAALSTPTRIPSSAQPARTSASTIAATSSADSTFGTTHAGEVGIERLGHVALEPRRGRTRSPARTPAAQAPPSRSATVGRPRVGPSPDLGVGWHAVLEVEEDRVRRAPRRLGHEVGLDWPAR